MVLKIKLGKKREKRLKKHLEKEHPSTRGHTSIDENDFGNNKQINKIEESIPDFKCQAKRMTKL